MMRPWSSGLLFPDSPAVALIVVVHLRQHPCHRAGMQ